MPDFISPSKETRDAYLNREFGPYNSVIDRYWESVRTYSFFAVYRVDPVESAAYCALLMVDADLESTRDNWDNDTYEFIHFNLLTIYENIKRNIRPNNEIDADAQIHEHLLEVSILSGLDQSSGILARKTG